MQHIVILQPPLRLIIELQATKFWTSSPMGKYHFLSMNHCPSVLSIFESDPALLLIVGYNSFPRPPENEGDSSFVGSQLFVIFTNYPQSRTSFCEGYITILEWLQKKSDLLSAISLDETATSMANKFYCFSR